MRGRRGRQEGRDELDDGGKTCAYKLWWKDDGYGHGYGDRDGYGDMQQCGAEANMRKSMITIRIKQE
jgi:hypothetical protein